MPHAIQTGFAQKFYTDFGQSDANAHLSEGASGSTDTALIVYSPEKYREPSSNTPLENFERHADFAIFKEQFIEDTKKLIAFIEQKSPEHHQSIKKSFELLTGRLFEDNYFSDLRSILYGSGAAALNQLAHSVLDEKILLATRVDTILNLSREVTVCAPGTNTNLINAARKLKTSKTGIDNAILNTKETQIEDAIRLFVLKTHATEYNFLGDETHYVVVYVNHLADRFGLTPKEDIFSETIRREKVTPDHYQACEAFIRKHLTPVNLATKMAEVYWSHIEGNLAQKNYGINQAIPIGQYSEVIEDIKAVMQSLEDSYGQVDLDRLIHISSDGESFRFHGRPTLLALDILDAMQMQDLIDTKESSEPTLVYKWRAQSSSTSISIHSREKLTWAETGMPALTKPERALVDAETFLEGSVRLEEFAALKPGGQDLKVLQEIFINSEIEDLQSFVNINNDYFKVRFGDEFTLPQLVAIFKKRAEPYKLLLHAVSQKDKTLIAFLVHELDANIHHRYSENNGPGDQAGNTLLDMAAIHGHTDVLEYLPEMGFDLNSAPPTVVGIVYFSDYVHQSYAQIAFMKAAKAGQTEACKTLNKLSRDCVKARDPSYYTNNALHIAASKGHIETVKALFDMRVSVAPDNGDQSYIYTCAAKSGNVELFKFFLERLKNSTRIKPDPKKMAWQLVSNGHVELLNFLIESNMMPIDIQFVASKNLADLAAEANRPEILKLLHSHGFNFNDQSSVSKSTPMHIAAQLNNVAAIEMLVELGANFSLRNSAGKTPQDVACDVHTQAKILSLTEPSYKTVVDLAQKLKLTNQLEDKDKYGRTALYKATERGDIVEMLSLIEAGANKTTKGIHGKTLLMAAAKKGHLPAMKLILYKKNDSDTDPGLINAQDDSGKTALMHAVKNFRHEALHFLLQSNASTDIKDNTQKTAINWAKNPFGKNGMSRFLLDRAAQVNTTRRFVTDMIGSVRHLDDFEVISEHYKQLQILLGNPLTRIRRRLADAGHRVEFCIRNHLPINRRANHNMAAERLVDPYLAVAAEHNNFLWGLQNQNRGDEVNVNLDLDARFQNFMRNRAP